MISFRRGSDLNLIARVMGMVRPYAPLVVLFFAISLLSTPLTLLGPISLKIAADTLTGERAVPSVLEPVVPSMFTTSESRLLLLAGVLFVLVALCRQLQELARTLLYTYIGERLVLRFRTRLFGQVQRLSLTYHDTRGTADSLYRIQYDATSVQNLAIEGVVPILTSSVTLVSMLYVIMAIDWQLGLIAVGAAPLMLFLTQTYRRRLRDRARHVKRVESSAMGVIQEVLGALRVVKAFGQEEREGQRFRGEAEEGVRSRIGLSALEGFFGLIIGAVTASVSALVLYIGARHVQSGLITLGELLLVMGYLSQLYDPLKNASKRVGKMQASLASAERAFALLDEAPDVVERPDARAVDRAAGDIQLQNVSFGYEAGAPVLARVSFQLRRGERLGVHGITGSGKTTLIGLLTRLYDPDEGSVLLDGVDVADYRVADLRSQFAVVLQEPVLFSTTIAENIAYAKPGATLAEIEQAARAASIHDFIASLPDGYETVVGERGMRLSGGERQRVALARAFLKDAPILILDEPTSSVDSATEASIIDAMERLMAGRTTIMIAHRLTTLDKCDLWLELQPGGKAQVQHRPPSRAVIQDTRALTPALAQSAPEGQAAVLQAWERVAGQSAAPPAVTTIKDNAKSAVYQLARAADDGRNVVAKHCSRPVALKEIFIHTEILRNVPGGRLAYHGLVDNGSDERVWLFLEEAEGETFTTRNPAHLAAAAEWFACLHRYASIQSRVFDLPLRDTNYYIHVAQSARRTIEENIDNPAISEHYREILREIIDCCARFTANADYVDHVVRLLPPTLVHGDIKPKNVRVLQDGERSLFFPFDWGQAGWGTPAADLCKVDRDVYWAQARVWGLRVDRDDVEQVADLGRALWAMSAISGEASNLAQRWVDRTMAKMWDYRAKLVALSETAGWNA